MLRLTRLLTAVLVLLLALAAAGSAGTSGRAVAVFFYPWYGTPSLDGAYQHWNQSGHDPPLDIASSFYPLDGVYSSDDAAVLDRQMQEIAAAGITDVITSWWGRGSVEDSRLPAVLAGARKYGLRVAVHLEPYPDRSLTSIASDIAYLHGLGIGDFYVYGSGAFSDTDWAAMNAQLTGVRVFAQTALVGWAARARFTGVYSYDIVGTPASSFARMCAQAHAQHLLCAPSVGPGYDASRATGELRIKERRDGATYDSMWGAAIQAAPDLVTITSFNEWHEGTQIEPAGPGPKGGSFAYETYDGAYGLHGAAASDAYLVRTRYWADRFRSASIIQAQIKAVRPHALVSRPSP